jgi:hypothetical protein
MPFSASPAVDPGEGRNQGPRQFSRHPDAMTVFNRSASTDDRSQNASRTGSAGLLGPDWGSRRPQAQEEYDIYVHPLAAMLRAGASASEIADHLLHIETVRMGLRCDPPRAHSVAKKLRTLRGL